MDIKSEAFVSTNGGTLAGGSLVSSPTSARIKRNRSIAGFESSPGSADGDDGDDGQDERRRQPGVKRACNECRQQKVSLPGYFRRLKEVDSLPNAPTLCYRWNVCTDSF